MICSTARLALTLTSAMLWASFAPLAHAGGTLRIAMTASDVPTTTGAPDNGFEGLRFFGYPVYEGLVLWDLKRADRLAEIKPGLAESWEQDKEDKSKWIFHLRKGVKFHDDSDFNADAPSPLGRQPMIRCKAASCAGSSLYAGFFSRHR
jgi:peptide/nickel transport system substrate-binding protein